MEEPLKIPLESSEKNFEEFLNNNFNKNILFSGEFGAGKTTFLKDFFKARESKYKIIRLAPVNYSVAATEDIFELIKFDIFFQLYGEYLGNDIGVKFTPEEIIRHLYALNLKNGIQEMLSMSEKTGRSGSIVEIVEQLEKNQNESPKHHLKEVVAFIKKHTNDQAGIREFDLFSQLITILVDGITAEKKQQSVLIVDDLDRVDPDHIFRILNVFAAHFDVDQATSKFNFSKIILVSDVNNLRKIFKSKYGAETDFSGYINKFYSTRVFNFDSRAEAAKWVSEVTSKYIKSSKSIPLQKHEQLSTFVAYVLYGMFLSKSISLRHLSKLQNSEPKFGDCIINEYKCDGIGYIEVLIHIVGDLETLRDALKRCIENNANPSLYYEIETDEPYSLINLLIPLTLGRYKINKRLPHSNQVYRVQGKKLFNFFLDLQEKESVSSTLIDTSLAAHIIELHFFHILLDAITQAEKDQLLT